MRGRALRRRDVLTGVLAGLLCAPATRLMRRAGAVPTKQRPRYLVIFQLSGGPDSILTLDPKSAGDIESWVDNPMPRDNVTSGPVPLGALYAPLARWAPQMAVVHGVRVESVNHPAGSWQLVRMRRRVNQVVPGILDIVAHNHDRQPLGALSVGDLTDRVFTPNWTVDGFVFVPGQPSYHQGFDAFESMDPDDVKLLAHAMHEHASAPSLLASDRDAYARLASYLDRLPTLSKFAAEDWKPAKPFVPAADGMQRVLWALENDLVPGAFVTVTRNEWDTHFNGLKRQVDTTQGFLPLFQRFLDQLHARRNTYGLLADNTTIVVAGELGRYPRVNSDKGKDHFPEISMLFMGAGIRTGQVIGQTGKDMLGVPLDPATGKLAGTRHLVLDDVGTTLLHLFGIDPTRYGYFGRPIEPLLA